MGRRKFRLGRHRKNAEKQRQIVGKNSRPGRPRKRKGPSSEPTKQVLQASTTQGVPGREPPVSLTLLHSSLVTIPHSWSSHLLEGDQQLQVCKLTSLPSTSHQPVVVTHTVCVQEDLTWSVFVHGNKIDHITDTPLSSIPSTLNPQSLQKLILLLDAAHVCPGNPDEHFIALANAHKGEFKTPNGEVKARVEKGFLVEANDNVYPQTIRTTSCSLLVGQGTCNSCKSYRPQLRSMHSRFSKKSIITAKYANNRYLSTPEKKGKLKKLQARAYTAEKEIQRLREKIEQSSEQNGVQVQHSLNEDLLTIMTENNSQIEKHFPVGSFRRLFWEQQFQAAKARDARQMRWHPCMIRWCLNLKLLSSAAYHSLRTAGFIKLPSERTLRDYTHYIKSESGFSTELDQLLADEFGVDNLPEWKRYVVLVLDEMKVKESLVFDKNLTRVIGFVDMGGVNNQLADLEREFSSNRQHPEIATHILVLMVRGIFTGHRFPYAHFSTTTCTAEHLFEIMWEAVERIEHKKLKVLVVCADGASMNRKMFRMHGKIRQCVPYNPV